MILKRQDLLGGQENYLNEEALASLANNGVHVPLSNSEMNRAFDSSTLRPSSYFNTTNNNNNNNTREADHVTDNKPQGDSMPPAPAPTQTVLTQPQNHFQTTVPQPPSSNIFNAGYNANAESAPVVPMPAIQPAPRLETRTQTNAEGRRLVVGSDISLNGEITTCDILIVEGNVQAVLKDCKHIVIAPGGTFKGNAEIDNAEISGVYEGNLSVRGRLHITGSGRVQGTIRYSQLQVDPGAEINAEIQSMNNAMQRPVVAAPVSAGANAQPNRAPNRTGGGAYSNLYGTTAASGSF